MNYLLFLFIIFITYPSDVVAKYDRKLIVERIEVLSRQLKSPNGALRYSAVRKLYEINHRKTMKPLLYALYDRKAIIRSFACRALARLKYYKSVNPIIRLVKREKSHYVLKDAIFALGYIGDERARFIIQRFLKSNSMSLRLSAKRALKMLDKGVMPY